MERTFTVEFVANSVEKNRAEIKKKCESPNVTLDSTQKIMIASNLNDIFSALMLIAYNLEEMRKQRTEI
jgi:hypothetical protein